jgi:hypothetical protein
MRRPDTFPLFWTNADGFDYGLYSRLETEAEYFQINALHGWIKDKKYLGAVVVQRSAPIACELDVMLSKLCKSNEAEELYMIRRKEKIYVCPRDIRVHRGNPQKCGSACRRAQGDDEDEYEDHSYVEVVSVSKVVEFVGSVCKA